MTTRTLTHTEHKLLAALWRSAWVRVHDISEDDYNKAFYWECRECKATGIDKHARKETVKHAPGCALFGVDRSILAQLDAFDAMPEPV